VESLIAYIPMDRRQALAQGLDLPDRLEGAALFADISGFTPLTEALANEFGPQRGAEELTRHLNGVYDALIAEVDRFRGSVVSFSGDAITCWFDTGDQEVWVVSKQAVACALAMQQVIGQLASVKILGDNLSTGNEGNCGQWDSRRFLVGDRRSRCWTRWRGRSWTAWRRPSTTLGKGRC
jgi:class 3 adenylate cyclase